MRYSIQQCFQSVRRVMLGGVYTTTLLYEYGDFSVRFHTEEMQRLHVVVLSAEVNYARGMWACRFLASTWQALEVQHDAS